MKENQIALRAGFLEKEVHLLRFKLFPLATTGPLSTAAIHRGWGRVRLGGGRDTRVARTLARYRETASAARQSIPDALWNYPEIFRLLKTTLPPVFRQGLSSRTSIFFIDGFSVRPRQNDDGHRPYAIPPPHERDVRLARYGRVPSVP